MQFDHSPAPFSLEPALDAFQLSVPFLIEKVMEIVGCLLRPGPEDDKFVESSLREDYYKKFREAKKAVLQKKVQSVSRMVRTLKNVRNTPGLPKQFSSERLALAKTHKEFQKPK